MSGQACCILPMQIDHLPALQALWRSIPGIGLSSADTVEDLAVFLSRNPTTCFVAMDHGSLVGSVLGGSDGRRGYVYHLAVVERARQQGLGKALLAQALQGFRALGIQKAHLFVFGSNGLAISFYQSQGWQLREDIAVMSKALDSTL
ncbi:MAG: GNAT family N-acetyltransferase [Limnochordia bacterium]|jgi:ribosomal protein S18 acetylase RimI-like enzyme